MRAALFVLVLWLTGVPAFAQGCAMCYSTAAAASKDGQRAISKAVLVLLVPPVGFMTFGMSMAFRYARKRDLEVNRERDLEREPV